MEKFSHIFKSDCDKRVKIGEQYLFCYSKKKLEELYPAGNYTLLGEAKKSGKQKKTAEGEQPTKLGEISVAGKNLDVEPSGTSDSFFNKTEGYLCVGDGKFIALRSSRLPFILTLAGIIAALIICLVLILLLLLNPKEVEPDHPKPELEPNVVLDEKDTEERKETEEAGAGATSMSYKLTATLTPDGQMSMYFKNPGRSSHDVVVELYVASGSEKYLLFRTGLIPAGSGIYTMALDENAPTLKEGEYTGFYKVIYYDPATGERALVESQIDNVKITVKP